MRTILIVIFATLVWNSSLAQDSKYLSIMEENVLNLEQHIIQLFELITVKY